MIRNAALLVYCMIANGVATGLCYGADVTFPKVNERVLNDARALLEDGEYAAAKEILRSANATAPGNPDVLNLLGFLCIKKEQLGDAAVFYAQALEIDPDHRGALEYQGELYLKLDRPEKAKVNLAHLARICAKNCTEYEDLARAINAYGLTK